MDVSVGKQFKEYSSRNFLYLGLVLFSAFLVAVFGYLNFATAATVPNIITYQGKLLTNGSAVTTTQAISYVLYDAVSSGNALYSAAGNTSSPATVSTTVNDGFFTIDLGDTGTNIVDPTIFKNNQTVYLEVTIAGETLVPRKRITASPFAMNAKYLEGIGASSTPQSSIYIPISDSSGNFNFNNVTSTGVNVSGNSVLATTTISNLNSASGTISNLNSTEINTDNLIAVSATFTNATTTGSFWADLLTAATGWFTDLFWTDATSTGHTQLNTLTTTGATTLATTTISSSTVGYLNVSNNIYTGGLLSVIGNSTFGDITAGVWKGTVVSSTFGGTNQNSSNWTGFTKVTNGVWATSSISTSDLTNANTLAFLANNQTFTGSNTFATGTFNYLTATTSVVRDITVSNNADIYYADIDSSNIFLLQSTNAYLDYMTSSYRAGFNILNATGNTTLATTTISSSTIGYLNVSNDIYTGGLLSVIGNSTFGDIIGGVWKGNVVSSTYGGTNQNSSGWTGFTKVTNGVWATSTIGLATDVSGILPVVNGGTGTSTFSSGGIVFSNGTTLTQNANLYWNNSSGYFGVGTAVPAEKMHLYNGTLLVDNPVNPTIKGSLTDVESLGGVGHFDIAGKFAYVGAVSGGVPILSVVDISNPAFPSLISTSTSGQLPTNIDDVQVLGKLAYVFGDTSGLKTLTIMNLSDSGALNAVGSLTDGALSSQLNSIFVVGKYVYATGGNSATGTFQIIEVTQSNHPKVVSLSPGMGQQATLADANSVYVQGKYAFLTASDGVSPTGTLICVDVSAPNSPSALEKITDVSQQAILSGARALYVSGKYAYVVASNNSTGTLAIVDVGDPMAMTVVGYVTSTADQDLLGGAKDIEVSGKYAYLISRDNTSGTIAVVDISSSTAPYVVGSISDISLKDSRNIKISGKYVYTIDDGDGTFSVVDIKGADISSANIGNMFASALTVSEKGDFGSLSIQEGLNVGSQGIYSNGAVAINVDGSLTASNGIFSVSRDSTVPAFFINGSGNVFVNSTSSIGTSYKMFIDAEGSFGAGLGVNGFIVASGYISGTSSLDLAETYPINLSCNLNNSCPVAGDVVCSDETVVAGVKKCSLENDDNIIGIVSINPGFLLGGGDFSAPDDYSGKVKVALSGRVPTKVSTENGPINVGDKLTLSSISGVAAKAVGEVQTVGVAMENYSGDGVGEIIVFVNLGWQNELYRILSVDTDSKILNVGTDITPYNLALNGELTMFNNVINKLVFNTTALFESRTNNNNAFIFNAVNFGDSTEQVLLSLRSNDQPRFSVMANGDIRATGNLYAASAVFGTSTNPGDLAERVDIATDDIVEPGDVLVVDMNSSDTYRRSSGVNEQAVAGVVSTNPTIVVGNGKTDYTAVMAMVGRVPLKVSDENGDIVRGDLLVTASSTGYAMKYNSKKDSDDKMIGIVGVALDSFGEGKGKIMALVRTGWVNSRYETISSIKENISQLAAAQGIVLGATSTANLNVENNNGALLYSSGDLNLQGNLLLNVASIVGKDNRWSIDASGHFITRINTSQGEKEMFAIQSPTSEFVFSSSSQLIAGEVRVLFDQSVNEIIDFTQPLKINVTLTSGEAKGIYVSEKNEQGFVIKELDNGTSGATFDWMVVAKRKEEINVPVIVEPEVVLPVQSIEPTSGDILNIPVQNSSSTEEIISAIESAIQADESVVEQIVPEVVTPVVESVPQVVETTPIEPVVAPPTEPAPSTP